MVSLEETTVGSRVMPGVLSPDTVVAGLESITCLVVEAEVVGLGRGTRVAAMLLVGIPGLALGAAVDGKIAVVVVVVTEVALATPVGREAVDSSLLLLVDRGVRVVPLGLRPLDCVVGNKAEGFPT